MPANSPKQRKATRGSYKPGQSGNPSGRPKEVGEVRELARQHTVEAVTTLAEIMRNPKQPAAARARACETLLDRGYGRAEQAITGDLKLEVIIRKLFSGDGHDPA